MNNDKTLKQKRQKTAKALDSTDIAILSELQADARLSNVELADRVGLTPTPCLERVKRLERDGVIQSYHARLDPSAIGLPLLVFVAIKTQGAKAKDNDSFKAAVAKLPQILECHMVAGGFDFFIKARVADIAEYRDFYSDKIAELPGVAEIQSYFVIDEAVTHAQLPLQNISLNNED